MILISLRENELATFTGRVGINWPDIFSPVNSVAGREGSQTICDKLTPGQMVGGEGGGRREGEGGAMIGDIN